MVLVGNKIEVSHEGECESEGSVEAPTLVLGFRQ